MFFAFPHLSNHSELDLNDLNLCENNKEQIWIWLAGTLLCFLVGFPASVAILWDMFKSRRDGNFLTPHSFFLLNLTIMDAVFMFFIPPGFLNYLLLHDLKFDAIWNFVYALNLCGRPLTMACICLDCYLAVVHPITYHQRKSLTPRVILVSLVWTLTIASGLGYAFDYTLFATMFPTVPYLVAVVIIGVCDFFIIYTLIKSDPSNNTIHPQKRRALQTVINSLVMTLISYLPPLLIYCIAIPQFSAQNFSCIFSIPASITTTLGSAVMPLLHLNNLGKLEHFMFGCCRKD
ncbi:P2Y purinoceptor 1-like [Cynoglossus semilaevis]|uniref:P2Y purinoceptor 1-like n=1 Tax=Cynoglossus semilaevis TaxID=244447 RepID=UPI000D62E3A7|nr:P2Y purinoceptor 1-like [Cynoglossus semilaevis]